MNRLLFVAAFCICIAAVHARRTRTPTPTPTPLVGYWLTKPASVAPVQPFTLHLIHPDGIWKDSFFVGVATHQIDEGALANLAVEDPDYLPFTVPRPAGSGECNRVSVKEPLLIQTYGTITSSDAREVMVQNMSLPTGQYSVCATDDNGQWVTYDEKLSVAGALAALPNGNPENLKEFSATIYGNTLATGDVVRVVRNNTECDPVTSTRVEWEATVSEKDLNSPLFTRARLLVDPLQQNTYTFCYKYRTQGWKRLDDFMVTAATLSGGGTDSTTNGNGAASGSDDDDDTLPVGLFIFIVVAGIICYLICVVVCAACWVGRERRKRNEKLDQWEQEERKRQFEAEEKKQKKNEPAPVAVSQVAPISYYDMIERQREAPSGSGSGRPHSQPSQQLPVVTEENLHIPRQAHDPVYLQQYAEQKMQEARATAPMPDTAEKQPTQPSGDKAPGLPAQSPTTVPTTRPDLEAVVETEQIAATPNPTPATAGRTPPLDPTKNMPENPGPNVMQITAPAEQPPVEKEEPKPKEKKERPAGLPRPRSSQWAGPFGRRASDAPGLPIWTQPGQPAPTGDRGNAGPQYDPIIPLMEITAMQPPGDYYPMAMQHANWIPPSHHERETLDNLRHYTRIQDHFKMMTQWQQENVTSQIVAATPAQMHPGGGAGIPMNPLAGLPYGNGAAGGQQPTHPLRDAWLTQRAHDQQQLAHQLHNLKGRALSPTDSSALSSSVGNSRPSSATTRSSSATPNFFNRHYHPNAVSSRPTTAGSRDWI